MFKDSLWINYVNPVPGTERLILCFILQRHTTRRWCCVSHAGLSLKTTPNNWWKDFRRCEMRSPFDWTMLPTSGLLWKRSSCLTEALPTAKPFLKVTFSVFKIHFFCKTYYIELWCEPVFMWWPCNPKISSRFAFFYRCNEFDWFRYQVGCDQPWRVGEWSRLETARVPSGTKLDCRRIEGSARKNSGLFLRPPT